LQLWLRWLQQLTTVLDLAEDAAVTKARSVCLQILTILPTCARHREKLYYTTAAVADQGVGKKAGLFHTNICSGRPDPAEMDIAAASGEEASLAAA